MKARITCSLLFAVMATGAMAETCANERRLLLDGFDRNRWVVEDDGFFNDAFGTCKISGLELNADGRDVVIGALEWTAEGLGALTTGTGQARLNARLRGLRVEAPRTGQGAFQSRTPPLRINGDVSVTWRLGSGELALETLRLELADQSAITVSLAAAGLAADSFNGGLFDLAGATLSQLEIVVSNRGGFDARTLGLLAKDATARRNAALGDATAMIDSLPDDVLTKDSRAALLAFVGAFPNPRGTLAVTLAADPPLSLLRASAVGLSPQALTPAALRFLLASADIDIAFTPADRAR